MQIAQFFGAGLLVLLLVTVLRGLHSSAALVLSVSATAVFLFFALELLRPVLDELRAVSQAAGYGEYLTLLLKALGVGIVSTLLSELCRDLGEGALSRVTELCGKGAMLALALPILSDFIELMRTAAALGM